MKTRDISQRELSRTARVSVVTINRMASNKTMGVSLATLDRLADALGCSVCDLIGDDRPSRRKK